MWLRAVAADMQFLWVWRALVLLREKLWIVQCLDKIYWVSCEHMDLLAELELLLGGGACQGRKRWRLFVCGVRGCADSCQSSCRAFSACSHDK